MRLFSHERPYIFRSRATRAPVYVEPANRPILEVSLILEGSITFVVDNHERNIKAPAATLSVCRKSLEVHVEAKEPTRAMWCHCSDVRLADAEWQWLEQLPTTQPISDVLLGVFTSGLAFPASNANDNAASDVFGAQVRDALGVAAFSEYVRQAGPRSALACPPHVTTAKRHLDKYYALDCDISISITRWTATWIT